MSTITGINQRFYVATHVRPDQTLAELQAEREPGSTFMAIIYHRYDADLPVNTVANRPPDYIKVNDEESFRRVIRVMQSRVPGDHVNWYIQIPRMRLNELLDMEARWNQSAAKYRPIGIQERYRLRQEIYRLQRYLGLRQPSWLQRVFGHLQQHIPN